MDDPNDPRNWSALHQKFEAHKKIKELVEGPHEGIRESFVRWALAKQYGVTPEEVTWDQIRFEVSDLLRFYPAIHLVPSAPALSEVLGEATEFHLVDGEASSKTLNEAGVSHRTVRHFRPETEPTISELTPAQVWKLIQKDFTLRLSLMTRELSEERQRKLAEIEFEASKRGNLGYYLHSCIDYELKLTNEIARKYYDMCTEIWEIQGRRKCRSFYRSVFDYCLTPLLAVHRSTVESQLSQRDLRQGRAGGSSAALGEFARAMERLRAEWNTKLEIADRDNENRQRVERERAVQATGLAIPPASNEPRTAAGNGETRIQIRSQASKVATQAMYKAWRRAYRVSKKSRPEMSDIWHSLRIAEMDIAKGRSAETIRKHMK